MPRIIQPEPGDIVQACQTGSLGNLNAWQRASVLPAMSREDLYNCVEIAIIYGQLSTLRWLCEESGYSLDFWSSPDLAEASAGCLDDITALAAEYSRSEILEWLAFDFAPITSSLPTREDDFSTMLPTAVENGHLDIVKWYLKELCPAMRIDPEYDRTLYFAVDNGQLEIIRWLVNEIDPNIDLNTEINYTDYDRPVALAASGRHLELVRWMVLDSGHAVDILKGEPNTIETAQETGHAELIDFLETVKIVQDQYGLENVPLKMKEIEAAKKKGTRRTGGRGGM